MGFEDSKSSNPLFKLGQRGEFLTLCRHKSDESKYSDLVCQNKSDLLCTMPIPMYNI